MTAGTPGPLALWMASDATPTSESLHSFVAFSAGFLQPAGDLVAGSYPATWTASLVPGAAFGRP